MKHNKEISRSKIDLFISCPLCFWLDYKFDLKRPEEDYNKRGKIGQKYDPILKREFDSYRIAGKLPEIIPNAFTLFKDFNKLKLWRNRGVRIKHESGFIIYGKIDDLLLDSSGYLIPFDFKTTLSKNFQIHESYRRQLEIYGYLLKKSGENVSNTGALYVVNIDLENNSYNRSFHIVPELQFDVYDYIIEKLIKVINEDKPPEPSENCQFCDWYKRRFRINQNFKI